MKIALVFPPLYGVDMPPLGLAYIAAKLSQDGHEVKVFCFNSRLYQENKEKRFLWDWDQSGQWENLEKINSHFDVSKLLEAWVREIVKFDPRIAGFSVNSHSRILANLLASGLKEKNPSLSIIFGGPWCAELTKEDALNSDIDVYVRGEGEEIISKIAKSAAADRSLKELNIEGTVVNTGEGFRDNGWNKDPLDINKVPFPALNLFDLDNYNNKEEIPIIFSRGCNYHCKFCTDKPMWGRHRMRSAENIVAEMIDHSAKFKRKRFKCNDLMVNGDLNGLNELADKIIQERLDFGWGGMARANQEMTPALLNKLKRSGCVYFTYGVESGSSSVLSHMGKPSKKCISRSLKMTHQAKIKVNTLWMVGYPKERCLDTLETMLFLLINRKNIDEFVSVSRCYIPKQSWLWNQKEALGINFNQQSDWYIGDTNTPSKREARRKRLLAFAKMLGIYRGGIT